MADGKTLLWMFHKLLLSYRTTFSRDSKKIWSPKRVNIHPVSCGGVEEKALLTSEGQKIFLLIYFWRGETLWSRTPCSSAPWLQTLFRLLVFMTQRIFFLIFKQSHVTLLLCLKIRWKALYHPDDSSLFQQGRTAVVAFLTFTSSLVVVARSRSSTETSESAAATLRRAKTDGRTRWHFTVMCHLHDGTP